jgi:hypothetical protein
MEETREMNSWSRPARIYELSSSSLSFFLVDVMSLARDFILETYSVAVEAPF